MQHSISKFKKVADFCHELCHIGKIPLYTSKYCNKLYTNYQHLFMLVYKQARKFTYEELMNDLVFNHDRTSCIAPEMLESLWSQIRNKCNNPNRKGPLELTQQEFLVYLRVLEAKNPYNSWQHHINTLNQRANLGKDEFTNRLGIHFWPEGPQTKDSIIDISNRNNPGVFLPCNRHPQFVTTSTGKRIDIGHSYAGLRTAINRNKGITRFVYTRLMGDLGDYLQSIPGGFGLWGADRSPPDQLAGNAVGLWLVDYYDLYPNKPLSEAYAAYFASQ